MLRNVYKLTLGPIRVIISREFAAASQRLTCLVGVEEGAAH